MKRAMPWSDKDDEDDSSSSSDSEAEADENFVNADRTKEKPSQVNSGRKKSGVDFEALKRFGYRGGLSVLNVPPPKEDVKQDWTWSTGKEHREARESEESSEELDKTRAAVLEGEHMTEVQTKNEKERKNLSFSQKEKRKRELGQASRGKNYVEEEKRLLRESGIYSGFDS